MRRVALMKSLTGITFVAAALMAAQPVAAQLAPQSARVLDVGCGSGAPACRLATEFGVAVVGITTSAAGVAEPRTWS